MYPTAQTIGERIEDLYGAPLAQLEALADTNPRESMLAALLGSHTDLAFAERNIDFQLQRLRQLAAKERQIGSHEAGHIADCARRISESVVVRDAHAKSVSAVLQSLHRVPVPQTPLTTPAPSAALVPAPASAAARTR
ncbi:hypothetical protein [Streptomyces sp. x-80]|uniref:hypothetical protein n=1 Tax=Streptomyces sp. x-80 TaxID=2789282 RepID=UPI00397F4EC0